MSRKLWLAGAAAVFVLAAGVPLVASANPQSATLDPVAAKAAADKAEIARQEADAAAHREQIAADPAKAAAEVAAKAKNDAATRQEQKALAQEQKAAAQAAKKAAQAAKKAGKAVNCVTVLDDGAFSETPEGIFADAEAPASGMVFLGSNRWSGELMDGTCVMVWAGVDGSDPTTGMVLVGVSTSAETVPTFVPLPGSGPLHVISAHGARLTLAEADGKGKHVFDVETQTWD